MGSVMQGRRLPDGRNEHGQSRPMAEGDYWRDSDGTWYARPPGCHIGSLVKHEITEHEDGTITASPSILHLETDGDGKAREVWHGFLERGVWRSC